MLRRVALLSAAMGSVAAQSTYTYPSKSSSSSPSASSSSTSSAPAATHTVKVGWPVGEHNFDPAQLTAEVGDTIYFEFYPKEHSAVYMDPANPCIPYEYNHPDAKGWWSGFVPVRDDWSNQPSKDRSYTVEVKSKDPMWFYCSAKKSCSYFGMVGVVNPPNNTVFNTVQAAAKAKTYELSPGDSVPSEEESAPGSSTQSQVPSGSTTPATQTSSSHGLSAGAIAGIVIGAIGAFALVGILFFLVGRKKKGSETATDAAAAADGTAPPKAPHDMEQQAGMEHPPMYQSDPRYSMVAPGSPTPWAIAPHHTGESMVKNGHQSMMSEHFTERNPHRLSELASQNYDPVEIYTPDLPTHAEGNTPTSPRPPLH